MNTQRQIIAPRPHLQSWGRFAGIVALYAMVGPLWAAIGFIGLAGTIKVVAEIASGNYSIIARMLDADIAAGIILRIIEAYILGLGAWTVLGLHPHEYFWLIPGHLLAAFGCVMLARQIFLPVGSPAVR